MYVSNPPSVFLEKSDSKATNERQGFVPLADRFFPNKRFVPMIGTTRACPLSFHERLIYSYLVFRRRHDQGATKRRIASVLGIGRNKAVPSALAALSQATNDRPRLVEQEDAQYWAVEPTGVASKWFAKNGRSEQPWFRSFSTYKVFRQIEPAALTPHTNALLMLLCSLAPRWGRPILRGQKPSGLATMLGVSKRFVQSALRRLCKLRLLVLLDEGIMLLDPTDDKRAWWLDRPAQPDKAAQFVLSKALCWKMTNPDRQAELNQVLKLLDKHGDLMVEAGYTEEQVVEYWQDIRYELKGIDPLLGFAINFPTLFGEAEEIHRQKGTARSSLGILRHLTPKWYDSARKMFE